MIHEKYRINYDGVLMYTVKNPGQGPVPKSLRGSFKSITDVKGAIDRHLASRKETLSAKAKRTGTD